MYPPGNGVREWAAIEGYDVMAASDLIDLGQTLCILANPGATTPDILFRSIRDLRRLTESLQLSRSHIAAGPLAGIPSIEYVERILRPTATAVAKIQGYVAPIRVTIYAEVDEFSLVRTENIAIANEFSDLANQLSLNSTQSMLIEEAVSSFRAGAFRACMVMTWNAIYDFMRQWVFDNSLTGFNTALTQEFIRRNGNPLYSPIQDYDDFLTGRPSERTVIDTCHIAGIFGERIRDELRQCLRRRNDSAHSTNRVPDATQASAYARDLLDIARGDPFA